MIKVGVIGAAGKMGTLACETVEAAEGLTLTAQITEDNSIEELDGCDVAIDFTHPGVVMDNVRWCIEHGIDVVVGTSGFTEERLSTVRTWLGESPDVAVLVIPNFSIGAVLLMRFATEAATYFESAEIVELHHPTKLDAPSGTALRTAQLMAAARAEAGLAAVPDATQEDPIGARGGQVEGIHVHSVRVRGLVAHQEVILGNVGETLTLRHDMPDRAASAPGILVATRSVQQLSGLTVGLEHVLGLG